MCGQSPTGSLVCLDVAANRLGVKRRRIYEIVNVLESVGVVLRSEWPTPVYHCGNGVARILCNFSP